MGISEVTGFKFCDICKYVIQETSYYQYKNLHFHTSKKCLNEIEDPEIRNNLELKKVKPYVHPKVAKQNPSKMGRKHG